jgi:endonuclease/exonuclease/phosphatase family metal-dependent hydrolase
MSRNLYVGTDLQPIVEATLAFQAGTGSLGALIGAVSTGYAHILGTNFPARAEALADEIGANLPDLVGLQEVSLIRTGSFNPAPLSASEVRFDYLKILLDELHERGLPYAPVAVSFGGDAEAPGFVPGAVGLQKVRLTDREVILARTDLGPSGLRLANVQTDQFDSRGFFARSWAAVDATVRGKTFRFITTHLEPPGEPLNPALAAIQVAQAHELLQGPAHTGLPVILVGDFNSNADGGAAIDQTDTYDALVGAGFTDAWSQTHPGDPGYTCCQSELLLNPVSELNERVDLVLYRGDVTATGMDRVGEDPADRTPAGPNLLWPSDHAGVVATLQIHKRSNVDATPAAGGAPGQAAERWAFDLAGVVAVLERQRREAETSRP